MSTADSDAVKQSADEQPGLTSAGQWLIASSIAFLGTFVVMAIVYLADGGTPFDFGGCVILVAINGVSLLCATYGLIAKPKGREWLFAIPSLGPILPLIILAVCVFVFFT